MTRKLGLLGLAVALAAGGAAVRAQDWQPNDGIFNPSGIPSLPFSQPRFADLDGDGDLDLILGSIDGAPLYFRNTGSATNPILQPGGDLLAAMDPLDAEMAVGVDLDGDGDLDLVSGGFTGLHLYENVGGPTTPAFAPVAGFFAGLQVGNTPVPALADLDGDGDQDLLVGLSENGRLKYYPNLGSPTAAAFAEAQSEIWFDVGLYAYPWFCDLDGDLDLDLVVGRDGTGLYFYRNLGTPTAWQWQADNAVFAGLAGSTYWNSPCVVDLTGDDRLDLIYGTDSGPLQYYVNTGTPAVPVWTVNSTLFGGVLDVGAASSPFFHDLDGDGDLDLVSGSQLGDIKYYTNTGTDAAPAWRADHAIFASIDHSIYSAITLGDIDADGLADAIVGDLSGQLFLHRNTGTSFVYDPTVFQGIDVGAWSVPRLVDLDGDLDLDLVVGNELGRLVYFRNQGQPNAPVWTEVVGYFGSLDVGSNCVPTFGDYDGDGDLDLFTGSLSHEVRYYENAAGAWIQDPAVVAGITAGQNAAPALADLDNDGDLDLTIGNYAGTFNYYENTSPLTPVADPAGVVPSRALALAAYPNPFNPITTIRYVLTRDAMVTLTVHDVAGRQVRTLLADHETAGEHSAVWTGTDDRGAKLSSGVYFCRLTAGDEAKTIKVGFVK